MSERREMSADELMAKWKVGSGDWDWDTELALLLSPANTRTSVVEGEITEAGRISRPVLLGDDGRVWDGHHRIAIASKLGLPIPYEYSADGERSDS